MDTFLWTMFIIGIWNTINMIARICYKEKKQPYAWNVFIGWWAGYLRVSL